MARKITNGTLTTEFRFTLAEAIEALVEKIESQGDVVEMPDFGEGESDSISIGIRDAGTNVNRGNMNDTHELALILVDNENDDVALPE